MPSLSPISFNTNILVSTTKIYTFYKTNNESCQYLCKFSKGKNLQESVIQATSPTLFRFALERKRKGERKIMHFQNKKLQINRGSASWRKNQYHRDIIGCVHIVEMLKQKTEKSFGELLYQMNFKLLAKKT